MIYVDAVQRYRLGQRLMLMPGNETGTISESDERIDIDAMQRYMS
jgi:hypothetical protein